MGVSYPDVVAGQPIEFSAQRHNDVNRLLNAANGIGAGAIYSGAGVGQKLKVYNGSDEILQAGWALGTILVMDGIADAQCVKRYTGNYSSGTILVLADTLNPGAIGEAIVSGTAVVKVSGTGTYMKPSSDGTHFVPATTGAKFVKKVSNDRAIILLGSDSGTQNDYRGFFHVEDASDENGIKALVSGGSTDLGQVNQKEFTVTKWVRIYLLAEYIQNGNSGDYKLTLTDDYERDKSSNEFALWTIADLNVKTDNAGNKSLEITQQWQDGEIYFSSRYWI